MESLLAFWADAGIDVCLEDEPVNRLAEAARLVRAAPSPVASLVPARPANPAQRRASDETAALEQAKRLAAGAQTLEALAEALQGFEGCGLRRNLAHQPVLWRGLTPSKIMIIAEAPLAEDETEARPGPEGQLLERMLQAAGLQDRCILTHTVFWHPPGGRAPSLAEQKICQPFLERAIGLIQPQYLLLLGAASARAMLGREDGILALRGQWFDWTDSDQGLTLPALVTMTPSFLLQQSAAKKKAWADLQSFNARALGV
jgi:DNA polymerase